MSAAFESAVHRLWNIDRTMSPVEVGREREAALVEGLVELARMHGREISLTYIDSNGEMAFNIAGTEHGRGDAYGEELAEVLSLVRRRTGIATTDAPVLPENSWCRINHFEVERMLKIVGADLFGIDGPGQQPSSPAFR